MSNNKIQIFEYGKLNIGEQGFKQHHFEKLVKLNERHGNQYFSVGNNRIYFSQYVGVIQVGNLIIEILPKADSGEGNKDKWQRAFITMLRQSGLLKVNAPTKADLHLRRNSLLDLFFEQFLGEIKQIIHKGLVKKYRLIKENTGTLKGKLLFSEQIQLNLIHKEHFFTQHQTYDRDNIYNQILSEALKVVSIITFNSKLNMEAKKHLLEFDGISCIKANDDMFSRLKFNRKTNDYKNAINIAKMILLNYSPDIKGGQDNILSLLFDMNAVFEKYIYVQLKKAESQYENISMSVSAQQRKEFWNNKIIKPDIVIELSNKITNQKQKYIIDTKWKVLKDNIPSDSDLKQIYAYNLHFGAKTGILLYPKVYDIKSTDGYYHKSDAVRDEFGSHNCIPYFAELFDSEGNLDSAIGEKTIKELIKLE